MENKKVILVTGASRGIGKEIALAFAKPGAVVVLNYLKEKDKALSIAGEIEKLGAKSHLLEGNVSDYSAVKSMIEKTVNELGRIDVLINNAGITKNRSIAKMPADDWDNVIKTNLNGVFYMLKEAAPVMSKAGGGAIVNIASIIGVRGARGSSNYAASKAGVIALTKTAAAEFGRFGVCVNAVLPGFHFTDMGKNASCDYIEKIKQESVIGKTTDINELAQFIVFLSGMKTVSGQVFNWDSRVI